MTDVLTELRARRDAMARARTEHFDIPGQPGWVLEAGQIGWAQIKEFGDHANQGHEAEVDAAGDVIAKTTVALHYRGPGGLRPLRSWLEENVTDAAVLEKLAGHGDQPLRWDDRLAAVFGCDVDSARSLVEWVIPSDIARVTLGVQILEWARTAHLDAATDAAGE